MIENSGMKPLGEPTYNYKFNTVTMKFGYDHDIKDFVTVGRNEAGVFWGTHEIGSMSKAMSLVQLKAFMSNHEADIKKLQDKAREVYSSNA